MELLKFQGSIPLEPRTASIQFVVIIVLIVQHHHRRATHAIEDEPTVSFRDLTMSN